MKTALISTLLFLFTGASYAQHTQWARNFSGNKNQKGLLMTTEVSGNLYLIGNFEGTVDFDPGSGINELTSAGLADIFIQKFNPDGELLWAKRIGGIDYEKANSLILDVSGNLLITGYFYETVDFDPDIGVQELTSTGKNDIFLLKLDGNGNFISMKQFGGIESDFANALALNAAGEIYITGQFEAGVNFDNTGGSAILTSTMGSSDIFVLKLDAAGNYLWANSMGDFMWDAGFFVAVDNAQNVYISGVFAGTVDFDPGAGQSSLTAAGLLDMFLLKLDASGNLMYVSQFTGDGNEFATSLKFDAADNLYLTGYSDLTMDLDPGAAQVLLTPQGGDDSFLAKYDSNGALLWSNTIGGTGSDYAFSSSFNSAGEIYLIGAFQNSMTLDPGGLNITLNSAGASDIFVAAFDANGVLTSAGSMGADLDDFGYNIIIDQNDNFYTSGSFSNTVDLDWEIGQQNISSNGLDDIFVCKLSPQPAPPGAIQGSALLCDGQASTFYVDAVSGAENYNWIPGDLQILSGQGGPSISVLATTSSGVLGLSVSNANGSTDTVYLNYTVNPTPVIDITVNPGTTVNSGTAVTLTANGANSYTWNNGVSNGIAFFPVQTDMYVVIGELNGCSASDSVEITVNTIGIQESSVSTPVRVYPTIVSEQLFIDLPDELLKSSYEVHNNSGKLILEGKLYEKHNEISFSGLNSGIYVISIDKVRIRVVKRD